MRTLIVHKDVTIQPIQRYYLTNMLLIPSIQDLSLRCLLSFHTILAPARAFQ